MISIAICDDESRDRETLGRYVEEYFAQTEETCEIQSFSSAKDLLEADKDSLFDLYFLDIMMPGIDGLELGRAIRDKNIWAIIVFTTVSRDFAFDAFSVQAFHYLEKPVKDREISALLDKVRHFCGKRQNRKIGIRTKKGTVSVNVDEIMYVENVARASVYRLRNGSSITGVCNRGTFEESVKPLDEQADFIHPHKSYFVNMHYIRTLMSSSLLLDNGTQISISRKRMAETKRTYLKFLVKEGESA